MLLNGWVHVHIATGCSGTIEAQHFVRTGLDWLLSRYGVDCCVCTDDTVIVGLFKDDAASHGPIITTLSTGVRKLIWS